MAIQIMQKRAKLTNFYSKKEDFTQNITIYIQSWATDVYLNIQSEYLKPTWPENLTTLRININWQVSVSWKRVQQTKFYNLANAMLGGRRPSISTIKTQRGWFFQKDWIHKSCSQHISTSPPSPRAPLPSPGCPPPLQSRSRSRFRSRSRSSSPIGR